MPSSKPDSVAVNSIRLTKMVCHAGPGRATRKPAPVRRWQHYMVELSRCAAMRWVTRASSMGRGRVTAREKSIRLAVHEKCQSTPHSSQAPPERHGAATRQHPGFGRDLRAATSGLHHPNHSARFRQSRRLPASLRFDGPLCQGARPALRRQPDPPCLLPATAAHSRTLRARSGAPQHQSGARTGAFTSNPPAMAAPPSGTWAPTSRAPPSATRAWSGSTTVPSPSAGRIATRAIAGKPARSRAWSSWRAICDMFFRAGCAPFATTASVIRRPR
jgi:hypothetical protein